MKSLLAEPMGHRRQGRVLSGKTPGTRVQGKQKVHALNDSMFYQVQHHCIVSADRVWILRTDSMLPTHNRRQFGPSTWLLMRWLKQ
jgi:hypothetical protein